MMPNLKSITINGISFQSIKDAVKYYHISARTAQTRLYNGWTIEQALGVSRPSIKNLKACNMWLKKQGTNTKICRECKEEKLLNEFYKRAKSKAVSSICKACFPFYGRRKEYNITRKEWEEMFQNQDSKCAICGSVEHKGRNWHTDHCHKTSKVRGVLCAHCNHLLGHAQDNIGILQLAIKYLRNPI